MNMLNPASQPKWGQSRNKEARLETINRLIGEGKLGPDKRGAKLDVQKPQAA